MLLILEHAKDKNGSQLLIDQIFWESKSFKNSNQRVQMIDILLKYILW